MNDSKIKIMFYNIFCLVILLTYICVFFGVIIKYNNQQRELKEKALKYDIICNNLEVKD